MNKEKIKHFKTLLQQKRSEIVQSVQAEEREGRDVVTSGGKDLADMATEAYGQELLFALSDQGRRNLRDIEDALRRIEEGTYGVCEECGKPIDGPRLEVIPHARHCITCQEQAEKQANQ